MKGTGMTRYLYTAKKFLTPRTFKMISFLVKQDMVDVLQTAVNICGANIQVDGIYGRNTLTAMTQVCIISEKAFLTALDKVLKDKSNETKVDKGEAKIMNFLARWEGTHIHYNKGEAAFTTSYGVYAHAFPNAEPVKYVEELAEKYNVNLRVRRDVKRINILMTENEHTILKKKCYAFYMRNFMDERVNLHFTNNRMVKSKLSFFSIAVNGGMKRARKSLQSSINVIVDGVIGDGTLRELGKHVDDRKMNNGMLDYMLGFYNRLVRNNPRKFARYLNGWKNRILATR